MEIVVLRGNERPKFDEESEALTCNIGDRKLCLKHDYVNASLHYQKNGRYHFDIFRNNGNGGSVRYCKRCKKIDCVHIFDKTIQYEARYRYYKTVNVVAHCSSCDKWIHTNGWTSHGGEGCEGNAAREKVLDIIGQEISKHSFPKDYIGFGSGFWCEGVDNLAFSYEQYGEDATRKEIARIISGYASAMGFCATGGNGNGR